MGEQEMEEHCGSFKTQQPLGTSHRDRISSAVVHVPGRCRCCFRENPGSIPLCPRFLQPHICANSAQLRLNGKRLKDVAGGLELGARLGHIMVR